MTKDFLIKKSIILDKLIKHMNNDIFNMKLFQNYFLQMIIMMKMKIKKIIKIIKKKKIKKKICYY
jgi:hypothetical protein